MKKEKFYNVNFVPSMKQPKNMRLKINTSLTFQVHSDLKSKDVISLLNSQHKPVSGAYTLIGIDKEETKFYKNAENYAPVEHSLSIEETWDETKKFYEQEN